MNKTLFAITITALVCSYLVLLLLIGHAIGGGWSGMASLGVAASLVISIPFFIGMFVYFKRNMDIAENNRTIYRLSVAFPFLFFGYWAVVSIVFNLGVE